MADMLTCSLNSGSNGNSIYVERDSVKLLFDAGISGKQAERRLALHGRDIRDVSALIISHDHADHSCCAGIFQRKFGLPIYMTRRTFKAVEPYLGPVHDVRFYEAGEVLEFGHVLVQTIPTPHDAVDGVMFLLSDGRRRLGILTDLGHVFDGLPDLVSELDFLYLESNYDPYMLEHGDYPLFLKRRIRGAGGHLSNEEAALVVKTARARVLKTVVLSHLSENNNTPRAALDTHRRIVNGDFALKVASRYEQSEMMRVL